MSDVKAKMSTQADETLMNVRTVKAFANEDDEITKFEEYSYNVYKIGMKKNTWEAFFILITQFNLYWSMTLTIYVGAELYMQGKVTIGTMVAFLFYMTMLTFNFQMFLWVIGSISNLMGTADKVIKIFNHVPKINTEGGLKIEDG